MAQNAAYILKSHGTIDTDWLQDCLNLFKERGVNIRKLLLLQDGCPDRFAMLEVHFMLPEQEHSFLELLRACMAQQTGNEQSLAPL